MESLAMQSPSEVYKPSVRQLPDELEPLEYPKHDMTKKVSSSGKVHFRGKYEYFFLSEVLKGEHVGLTQEDDDMWRVAFSNITVGFMDSSTLKFSPSQEMIYE